MTTFHSRREFLQKAALVTASALPIWTSCRGKEILSEQWRLNPAFRIKAISTDSIQVYTHQQDGTEICHHFTHFEADLLLAINENKVLSSEVKNLALKHKLDLETCRQLTKKCLTEYQKSGLVYAGELMKVKIVEVEKNG